MSFGSQPTKSGMEFSSIDSQAGLAPLVHADKIQVEQVISLAEAFTGFERNNKYVVRDGSGHQIYYYVENTDTCMRMCCKNLRGFEINVYDKTNLAVMRFSRDFECCVGASCCIGICSGCSFQVKVEAPPGNVIGTVSQRYASLCGGSNYTVHDEVGETVLKIGGPCCVLDGPCCPTDNEFTILTGDGTNAIGGIVKQYGGFCREFTFADVFNITFPADMSVKTKALVLGAQILLVSWTFSDLAGFISSVI